MAAPNAGCSVLGPAKSLLDGHVACVVQSNPLMRWAATFDATFGDHDTCGLQHVLSANCNRVDASGKLLGPLHSDTYSGWCAGRFVDRAYCTPLG